MEDRIFDLHNDCLIRGRIKEVKNVEIVLAVWTTRLKNPISTLNKAKNSGFLYAIEDLHFINERNLDLLCEYTPIYASLTWNYENNLAGGADSDASIKELGKKVINFLEKRGIYFDTAHLNKKTFFDCQNIVSKPFICSHACFDGVFRHKRNLSDEQIEILVKSNGLIGLTLVPSFMGKKRGNIFDIIRQIEYYLCRFPIENLAIGTDFFGTKHLALKNYNSFKALKNQLIKMNYTLNQIDKIFYLNAAKFFKKAEIL